MPLNTERMAANLRGYRAMARMSQDDVAEAIEVTRQTVSNYETGKQIPQSDILCALADLYGVSLDELVGYRKED